MFEMEQLLVAASAGIVGTLGFAHLVVTFSGPKLLPRDPTVRPAMEGTHLVITRQTTLWRAWIGFNASHSLGALLFALIYGYLAIARIDVLFESAFLQALGLATLLTYVVLAKLYWFVVPLAGTSAALALFATGVALARSP